ncbi:MAG: response regulator [Planctomycetota bacterium]
MSELKQRPVVVIDDDEAWITVIKQALRALGWRDVRCLSDPTYAVQLSAEFKPALVLLDLRMRGRDGYDVLADFSEHLPDVPVIILTGVDRVEEAVRCMRTGATDFLTKPIQRQRLEQAIRRAVGEDAEEESTDEEGLDFREALRQVEDLPDLRAAPDMFIEEALERSGGVVKDAAAMLGISAQAICNRRRRRALAEEAQEEREEEAKPV